MALRSRSVVETHPVMRSSSRPCSKAVSSAVISTFFLQAFFPFRELWPCVAGAPMFTPAEVVDGAAAAFPLPLAGPLLGRSYGFDAADAAACLDDEAGMSDGVQYTEKFCKLDPR